MRVTLNGETRQLSEGTTVDRLVQQLGLNGRRIAVEVNQRIVARGDYVRHALSDGDVIEIVHFIGGG